MPLCRQKHRSRWASLAGPLTSVEAEAQPRRRQELESKRRAAKEAAMQEQPIQPLSWEERRERLSRIVSNKTLEGWTVVDMNERDVWAVLDLPEKNR